MAEMGTAVWVPHETDVWQPGVIESRTDLKDGGIELTVSLPRAGRVETFQFGADFDELECETLKLRNTFDPADAAAGAPAGAASPGGGGGGGAQPRVTSALAVADLITLPYLNEPAILDALRQRSEAGLIYTNVGTILLAINPFKRLPTLYSSATLHEYRARGVARSASPDAAPPLPPHAYAVAEGAYRAMRVAMVERAAGRGADELCDQSILVRARGRAASRATGAPLSGVEAQAHHPSPVSYTHLTLPTILLV